jgi:hypothetical protein
MPTPQPSRQHNKQITLIMKNNHLKIAANKESKMPTVKKVFPYKLKKLGSIAMLSTASLLALNSCNKDDEPQLPLQTVEYTFGPDGWDEIYPASKLSSVGADKNVGIIKIKSDGKNWRKIGADKVLLILDPAFSATNNKGTGDKTEINNVTVESIDDSLKLVNYGYLVNKRQY